jgi:hypothetical protein
VVAIQKALEQAEEFEDEGDIDAANLLRAQAQAAKARLDGTKETSTALVPYDPMRLYARVLYYYRGAIADADFARIDYRRFFGYVRELDFILQEEAEAKGGTDKPKKQPQGEINAMLNQFPQPQEYTGEVIQLI